MKCDESVKCMDAFTTPLELEFHWKTIIVFWIFWQWMHFLKNSPIVQFYLHADY